MRNPEGVCDWDGKQRRDLKISGIYLTNRGIYPYFKDSRIAKSRKLREVVERHCASLECAMEMNDSDAEQFHESFAKFIRAIDELPNSDSAEKQFGQADVYDNAQIISNTTRIPGSRAKGKVNPRDGGKRGKGTRREANVTNWEDQPVEADNPQIQQVECAGGDEYQEIFGCQTMDVVMREEKATPQVIWIGGIGKLWGR